MDSSEIASRFAFHPATTADRKADHELVRELAGNLANALNKHLPEGREKAVVMTKLEEVMFWGNAAIARQTE